MRGQERVITSYSIHYTKLYDLGEALVVVLMAVDYQLRPRLVKDLPQDLIIFIAAMVAA